MLARATAYGAWRREVMFMRLMWESGSLLSTKICSALDAKSRPSRRVLSQLETVALYSTCSMR